MPYGITRCYLPPGRGDILGEEGREQEWGEGGARPPKYLGTELVLIERVAVM